MSLSEFHEPQFVTKRARVSINLTLNSCSRDKGVIREQARRVPALHLSTTLIVTGPLKGMGLDSERPPMGSACK